MFFKNSRSPPYKLDSLSVEELEEFVRVKQEMIKLHPKVRGVGVWKDQIQAAKNRIALKRRASK
jgi:hypothetical protein